MRYGKYWPLARKAIVALSLVMISTGLTGALSTCGGPGRSAQVLSRDLPPPPSWAVPAAVKRPPAGTPALEIAKLQENGRLANAGRLWCFRAWYLERVEEFGSGEPSSYPKTCPAE